MDLANTFPNAALKPKSDDMLACRVCQHPISREAARLTGQELRALWKVLGHEFSTQAWGTITPEYVVSMRECEKCGFIFFNPALAGNEAFYRELQSAGYYTEIRPEFVRAVRFAQRRRLHKVLDVGCGSGAFLNLAARAGCITFGIELNRAAGEEARAHGHQVFDCLLRQVDLARVIGPMDLVTLFQVLEHVPDPVGFLAQTSALLRPGGCLVVAVPSRHGVYRLNPYDPHQWPPHHLSQWRLVEFKSLARAAQLKLLESGGDVLFGSDIEQRWKLHNRLAPALGRVGRPGGAWLPKVLSLLYRRTGMRFIFPRWGSSIYACFQKL